MDLVDKISLAEKYNKDSVLNDDNLSDEQKVILYNKFFKKHLFKKNKDFEHQVAGLAES